MLTNWLGYLVAGRRRLLLLAAGPAAGLEDRQRGPAHRSAACCCCWPLGYLALCAWAHERTLDACAATRSSRRRARMALLQLVMSCANWSLIGGVIWVLLQGKVDYPHVLAVLLVAAVAGAHHARAGRAGRAGGGVRRAAGDQRAAGRSCWPRCWPIAPSTTCCRWCWPPSATASPRCVPGACASGKGQRRISVRLARGLCVSSGAANCSSIPWANFDCSAAFGLGETYSGPLSFRPPSMRPVARVSSTRSRCGPTSPAKTGDMLLSSGTVVQIRTDRLLRGALGAHRRRRCRNSA